MVGVVALGVSDVDVAMGAKAHGVTDGAIGFGSGAALAAKKSSASLRAGESSGGRAMAHLRWSPDARAISRWGKSPIVRWGGPVVAVAGGVLVAADNFANGDDGATAVLKAGIETGGAVLGGVAGAVVGTALCGGLPICGAAGAVVGGWAGGWLGRQVNQGLENSGFFRKVDSWFDWD